MALTAELLDLETLYNTLKANVPNAHEIQMSTDRDVNNAVWDTPNATAFRSAWDSFRPHLQQFEATLAAGATDVARNHNNNALVNGVHDAPQLPDVAPL
jgi:hypothetical protein